MSWIATLREKARAALCLEHVPPRQPTPKYRSCSRCRIIYVPGARLASSTLCRACVGKMVTK